MGKNNKPRSRRVGKKKKSGSQRSNRAALVLRGVGQVPAASVHLRYCARYGDTLDVGNAYIFVQEMRGNSAFDPDYTGVGAQPWGFDNYAGLYAAYRCYGSSIKVTFYTRTAATTNASLIAYVVPYLSDLTVSKGALNVMNLPFTKYKMFDNYHNNVVIKSSCTNLMMYPGINVGNNNFRALTSASPAFGWVWTIGVDGNSVAADTAVDVLVEIIYDLQFESPIELIAS
jgi:hypothetical protein